MSPAPSRQVIQADAIAWMAANPGVSGMSVVTSLPDLSELALDLSAWRAWFIEAVRSVIRFVPEDGVAIFYQSDIRQEGVWIDKGHLVLCGVDEENASLIWHKIVCRKPAGTIARGRPSYSHMICVSKNARDTTALNPGPDVIPDAGLMPWSRAMGVNACRDACRFLSDEIHARTVVDPFCGRGTVLAVANSMGMDAVGVDISGKRCKRARTLILEETSDKPAPTMHEAFALGAALFNAGEFWEAHEAWERHWRIETDHANKRFFQALIQITAAFHKWLVQKSEAPAVRLFAKGLEKLDAWPAQIDLATFREKVEACARAAALGKDDRALVPELPAMSNLASAVTKEA